jgi:RNA polymerase sigma factor (sigma-70 family)
VNDTTVLTISDAGERELRRRLATWADRTLSLPASDFPDAYQCAWRKLLTAERAGRQTRNLEHALRWAIRNSWLEELRRRRRRPAVPLEDALICDPRDELERLERLRSLVAAMVPLGPRTARVLLLRELVGLAPDEVCAAVGITRRTYRAEHARAVRASRSVLAS